MRSNERRALRAFRARFTRSTRISSGESGIKRQRPSECVFLHLTSTLISTTHPLTLSAILIPLIRPVTPISLAVSSSHSNSIVTSANH